MEVYAVGRKRRVVVARVGRRVNFIFDTSNHSNYSWKVRGNNMGGGWAVYIYIIQTDPADQAR